MNRINKLEVFFHERKVGTLSRYKERLTAFQYSEEWLNKGFSLNPITIPLSDKIFFSEWEPFRGLHGVFSDSLPDGWGALTTDRFLRSKGISPEQIDKITRLSFLRRDSFGALEYKPSQIEETESGFKGDFDELFSEFSAIDTSNDLNSDFDNVFELAGSSQGARPKASFYSDDGRLWIVKFPGSMDSCEIGLQEYEYNLAARKCGIETSEVKLLPSKKCGGFFATKRFDRTENNERIHMASVAGLLEADYSLPCLDYSSLLKLTRVITRKQSEVMNMFKRMCFNVFAHNRDDHAKNFSFIYNEDMHEWSLSPAYDLTFSNSFNGYHATTVNGNGLNPGKPDLIEVALNCGLDMNKAKPVMEEIEQIVNDNLSRWIGKK